MILKEFWCFDVLLSRLVADWDWGQKNWHDLNFDHLEIIHVKEKKTGVIYKEACFYHWKEKKMCRVELNPNFDLDILKFWL